MRWWLRWRKRRYMPANQGSETASLGPDFRRVLCAVEQAFRLYMQEQAKALALEQQSKQVLHR